MSPLTLNWILFITIILVFAYIGYSSARSETTVSDFFHHPSLRRNVISLAATNVTLGTGLAYLVSGAQQNGTLFVFVAIATAAGYWLLGEFLENATAVSLRSGRNFLASVDDTISAQTGRRSHFAFVVSASLVFVFVLLLAFEIFASAAVISPLLFQEASTGALVALSALIFAVTAGYALLGGIRAMLGVDILQVPLVCIFLPVFFVVTVPDAARPAAMVDGLVSSLRWDHSAVTGVVIACIGAITTQFYSILNWGAVSNIEISRQRQLLRWTGVATACVLTVFIMVGLLHPLGPDENAWSSVASSLSALVSEATLVSYLGSAVVLLGMASILLTTTDAIVVNSLLFVYDNVLGGDSKALSRNPGELQRVRFVGGLMFSLCFVVLLAINYWKPDPFYFLLSMAGGVTTFAPMIVAAGWLASRDRPVTVFNNVVVWLFGILFLVSGIVNAILLAKGSTLIPYVGTTTFILSALLASAVCLASVRREVS